jgi:hypothetical protein
MKFTEGEDFIIEGNVFKEGWNSYKFVLSVFLNDRLLNSNFEFTVDTAIDCETDMIFQPVGLIS